MREKIMKIIKTEAADIVGLRKELFSLFNLDQHKNYDYNNSSVQEDEEVAKWILTNDINFIGFDIKEGEKRVFINETQKISFLSQSYCRICDDKSPINNFPVRITPLTRQTSTELKNAFKEQFSKSPYGKNLDLLPNDKLCIKLVFILSKVRDKDLDNMAKLCLDALKEHINIDDKNIDHLELIKFKSKYLESFINIRISKSDINTSDNIILKGTNLGWAGLDRLDK